MAAPSQQMTYRQEVNRRQVEWKRFIQQVASPSAPAVSLSSDSDAQVLLLGTHDSIAFPPYVLHNIAEKASDFHFHSTTHGFDEDDKGYLIIVPDGKPCIACQPSRRCAKCGDRHFHSEACDVLRCSKCRRLPSACQTCVAHRRIRVDCDVLARNSRRCIKCHQRQYRCLECERQANRDASVNVESVAYVARDFGCGRD